MLCYSNIYNIYIFEDVFFTSIHKAVEAPLLQRFFAYEILSGVLSLVTGSCFKEQKILLPDLVSGDSTPSMRSMGY